MISGLSGTGESSVVQVGIGKERLARTECHFSPPRLTALIFIRPRSEVVLEMTSVSSGSQLGEGPTPLLTELPSVKPTIIIFHSAML